MTDSTTARPTDTADDWAISAAMINFPGVTWDGTVVQDQPIETWRDTVQQVADAGFTHIDPTDSWVQIADLSPARLTEFADLVADVGLTVGAISTARRSVIDASRGEEYLAYSHRVIDTAATLGVEDVSFGLFQALTPAQAKALWFWTVPGHVDDPDDKDQWALAVSRLQELGRHGAEVGVHLSLEMYEDTYLGTADSSVRLHADIDLPNVWLNPDIGNIQRLHRPVEHWQSMIEKMMPLARYWHVKNYFRTEDATTGAVVTAPAPMELGVINYRLAARWAIEHGFRGSFLCEHYGGDGLSVSATNRTYLQRILPPRPTDV